MLEQAYYRKGKGTIRAFQLSSGIQSHFYSKGLQRVLVDFGIDEPFNKAEIKLKEHYGIDIPVSGIRRATLNHATKIKAQQDKAILQNEIPQNKVTQLISETDGSMVPIVINDLKSGDKRKHKQAIYREARLSIAREAGSINLKFSGQIGSTAESGLHMKYSAVLAGLGKNTKIHAVGDGAPWIAEEVDSQFGSQAKYLVDFYHVSEYLAEASKECAQIDARKWLHAQQQLLKCGKHETVLNNLRNYAVEHEDSATYKCYHYLHKRTHQLDYLEAINHNLPIGSGEIESAHRYIIQCRLKIAGAWWKEDNANAMIALRTYRANGQWQRYWDDAA